jgi:hypothetical protein
MKVSFERFENSLQLNPFDLKKEFSEFQCILCGKAKHESQVHKALDKVDLVLPRERRPLCICTECFTSDPEE